MGRKLALLLLCVLAVPLIAQDAKVIITSPVDVLPPIDVGVTPAGELKVSCTAGNCGGGGGTQDVNIIEVGGVAVTTAVPVTVSGGASGSSAALVPGTLAATVTAAAIGTGAIVQVLIQNDPDNTVDMLCGSAVSQPIQMVPGDAMSLNVTTLDVVFCKTVSGTGTVNYVAR